MKHIVLLLVVLAIAAIAIAQTTTATATPAPVTTTPAPATGTTTTSVPVTTGTPGPSTTAGPTTTSGPTTTGAPGATTTAAPLRNAVFGTKMGNATTGSGIILGFHQIGASTVAFNLMHNVANPTAITIHGAATGASPTAPVIFTFPASNIAANTLITATVTLAGEQVGWLFDGKMYAKITGTNTVGNPIGFAPYGGWKYSGILTGRQVAGGSSSNGVGLMIAGGGANVVSVDVQHNLTDATRITINSGAACAAGTTLFTLPASGVSATGVFDTATPATFTALDAGNVYVQIANPTHPDGAIRGQAYSDVFYNNAGTFENRNCQSTATGTPTPNPSATPHSSAKNVTPSIILVIVAIIASLML